MPSLAWSVNYGKTWDRFFVHFFCGKSLSAENSAEFFGKMIFQNFIREKFHFFPTFFG
jgi:hypothetical protein